MPSRSATSKWLNRWLPTSTDKPYLCGSLPFAAADFQHCQERLLRDIDPPDPFHAALAFFLLFEQLALAADVAAVAFGQYVFAHTRNRFPRDHFAADGRL